MSDHLFLQQLSVKDFLSHCNWHGEQKTNDVLATDHLHFWQLASVKDFFISYNWNGVANLAVFNNHHCSVFSLVLNVVDFWQCFNWSGTATNVMNYSAIAECSNLAHFQSNSELISPKKSISVTDLSQLF